MHIGNNTISLEHGIPLRVVQLGPPYMHNVRLDNAVAVVASCRLLQEVPAVCDAATTTTASSMCSSTVRKSVVGHDANQMAGVHFYSKEQKHAQM